METNLKTINSNQVELTVELGQDDLRRYVDQTERELAASLEIDGFRKGKVPKELARKHLGDGPILKAAMEGTVSGSLSQALQKHDLDVANAAQIQIKENGPQKLVYSVVLTLYPKVEVVLNRVKVTRRPVEVKGEEVDETIKVIQASRAAFQDKEGPADKGDRVEVDFEVSENGKVIEGGVSKNHPVVIGKGAFVTGFEDELVGMKKEEEKRFSLVAPKEYQHKAVAGKKLDFVVKMNDVKKIELPKLDDDFAKSLGQFQNMEQLTLSIKGGLQQEKEEKERQRIRLEALEKIADASVFSVPESMINNQLDLMLKRFDEDLHQREMELDFYLTRLGKTKDQLRQDWRSSAERQVKMALVLHALAKSKHLSISSEELDEAVSSTVQSILARDPQAQSSIDLPRLRTSVMNELINEKTLSLIEETCITR